MGRKVGFSTCRKGVAYLCCAPLSPSSVGAPFSSGRMERRKPCCRLASSEPQFPYCVGEGPLDPRPGGWGWGLSLGEGPIRGVLGGSFWGKCCGG